MPLTPGIERRDLFTVEDRLLTDVGGTLKLRVLSTPSMISRMERACARLTAEHLPEGQGSVGFEVCVRHVAGAVEGTQCEAHARLREVAGEGGRKLRFDVEVVALDGDAGATRTIGLGTHERRVIDLAEHASSAGRSS